MPDIGHHIFGSAIQAAVAAMILQGRVGAPDGIELGDFRADIARRAPVALPQLVFFRIGVLLAVRQGCRFAQFKAAVRSL